jgi:hypothetical protein
MDIRLEPLGDPDRRWEPEVAELVTDEVARATGRRRRMTRQAA